MARLLLVGDRQYNTVVEVYLCSRLFGQLEDVCLDFDLVRVLSCFEGMLPILLKCCLAGEDSFSVQHILRLLRKTLNGISHRT